MTVPLHPNLLLCLARWTSSQCRSGSKSEGIGGQRTEQPAQCSRKQEGADDASTSKEVQGPLDLQPLSQCLPFQAF